MRVDFKITTWERVDVPEDKAEEVLAKIKSGEIKTVIDLLDVEGLGDINFRLIDGVEEYMSVEENQGFATIEVSERGETPFYANGKLY